MDPASLYSTRIRKSFDEDQADILSTFRTRLAAREQIKPTLINYFQGLPIIYPATVVAVEHGCLDLDVNPQQAVVIAAEHYTLIRCKLFTNDIIAHVQYVNIKKHAVTLTKLSFVEIMAERRTSVRIDITPPISSSIVHLEQSLSGELGNISANGLAINFDRYVPIEPGSEISIKFMLPDPVLQKQNLIAVAATLINISGQASPYLYTFRITPDKHQEQLISRYIFQRQVEIIKDIKSIAE